MFVNLQEFEAPRMDHALGTGAALGAPALCAPVLQELDYLFVGAPERMPALIVAGGVLGDGTAVSGAGSNRASALTRLAGEAAEQIALRGAMPAAAAQARPAWPEHPAAPGFETDGWIAAQDWSGERQLGVPAALMPAAPDRTGGFSEGMAAHPDLNAARLHGALELIERDAVALWWAGAHKAILLNGAQSYATARLGPRLGRQTLLLDVSCDTQVPVIVAVSFDKEGGGFCFGAAAAPGLEHAANSALRELGASEFGLALERSRAGQTDARPNRETRWAGVIERAAFEAQMIGATVDLEARSSALRTAAPRDWAAHFSALDLCFVDLGRVGGHFRALKALSAVLQPGRAPYETARMRAATQGRARPYEGPLY